MLLDHDGRHLAELHGAWSETATAIVAAVRDAFEVLTAIQFAAPWKDEAQPSAAVISAASTSAQPPESAASRS